MRKEDFINFHKGFGSKVSVRTNDFKDRFYDLIDYALSNTKLDKSHDEILKKIATSKEYYFNQVKYIYSLLSCINAIIPNYNESWLLFGKGGMFVSGKEINNDSSIRNRVNEIIDYIITNIKTDSNYIHSDEGVITENIFIEFINILLIDDSQSIGLIIKDRFPDPNYDHNKNEERVFKIEDKYNIDIRDKYWLIEEFQNFIASMNRLKKIIPGFNESWLMFGEGDMFEKNSK